MSAVSVEGIWKFYGDYPALREIDFVVEERQCLALLGRNGAGKTTMLRMLAGLLRPQRGAIRLFGRDSHEAEARASFARSLRLREDYAPAWFGQAAALQMEGKYQEALERLTGQ